MRKVAGFVALAMLCAASSANAASFVSGPGAVTLDSTDDFTWTVNFAGESGAAGTITFNFLNTNAAGTAWNFSYTLDNTSLTPSLASRLGVFGFDTSASVSSVGTGGGDRFQAALNGGNFNGLGNRDVCFYSGPNCNGSGNNGVTVAEAPVDGTFSLNFATGQRALVLDDFAARWQAAGPNANLSLSAAGTITSAVPEPTTWAMMMLGFGAIGFAMRRRPAVRFAHA